MSKSHSAFGSVPIANSSPTPPVNMSPALSSTRRPVKISSNTKSFCGVYSDLMTELYNEPTQGLYFVNQHLEKMGPRLVQIKYGLDDIRQKLQTALTDVTEDIDQVDLILKSQSNLGGSSQEIQQLRHDYGHSMMHKKSASKSKRKYDAVSSNDNNDGDGDNDGNGGDQENNSDDGQDDDDDFGFGQFLQISVMLSQCRSLMEVARNLDE